MKTLTIRQQRQRSLVVPNAACPRIFRERERKQSARWVNLTKQSQDTRVVSVEERGARLWNASVTAISSRGPTGS